ncbi:hypothetical protein Poly30_50350 [Planctomycetes bacterium Poly30]|uniref:Uncharacterized protein n=1 Tax=Saltatorellus ferox TaxID=2528018 RepID=A0A518EZG1_9BACT|nr:hypothetical protein Poly30_50350 [Planctomycetes bacterium Poly30]
MAILLLTSLLVAQSIGTSLPPANPLAGVRRPALATLEGAPGAGVTGLFDLRSGQFVPDRLDPALRSWANLEPMPIDISGRSELTSGLAHSAQLRVDAGLGSRIVLPRGRGSLWMLRGTRAGLPGFALVHVAADGHPRLLLERDALAFGESPFLPKIGLDPWAAGLMVATVPGAGGDLMEVDIDSAAVEVRTSHLPPLNFGVDGVWLGELWGFGVASDGPYRFLRRAGATAALVQVAGTAPAVWRGDAFMNPVCGAAVAVAGSAPDAWQPFVFDAVGMARAASSAPQDMRPAGFLPEFVSGPFLALCNDGVTAAWCVEDVNVLMEPFTDVVLGRAEAVPTTVVASGDAQMVDTLNEVGRVTPSPAGGILFAVGEPNVPAEGGLEGAEVLSAALDGAGQLTLRNLSGTSNDTLLPLFDTALPTWTPARVVFLNEEYALVQDDDGKELQVLSLISGQRTTVLDAIREVYWIEPVGPSGGWVAAIERDDANRRQQIIAATSAGQAASVLDAGSPTVQYLKQVAHHASGAVAYIRQDAGVEFLDVVEVSTLQLRRWSQTPGAFQPPLAFIGRGSLAFTRQAGAAGGEQRLWNFRSGAPDRVISAFVRPSMILR